MYKGKVGSLVMKGIGCLVLVFMFAGIYSDMSTQAATTQSVVSREVKVTQAPARPSGDVDFDGDVDMADAQLALKATLNIIQLSPEAKANADINGDGVVDMADAQSILNLALSI